MFIEEYLQDLRRNRFAPGAVALYAGRLAARARAHLYANPGSVRSLWSVALGLFAAAFAAAVGIALLYERRLAADFLLYTALWIVPTFALVTLFLELLRDRNGYRLSALNVPVTLTLLRLTLVPGLFLFLTRGHFRSALLIYGIASLSDVADGWAARRWNQVTRLGTVLDPQVDIVFSLGLLLGLMLAQVLPWWVFGLAVLRYAILLFGASYLYLFVGPVKIYPTLFGRLTGVGMTALVAMLLTLHALGGRLGGHLRDRLETLTVMALAVLLAATVVHVLALGWYNLRVMTGAADSARGRVVGDVRMGAK